MRHRNPHTNRSGTGLLRDAWLVAAPILSVFGLSYAIVLADTYLYI